MQLKQLFIALTALVAAQGAHAQGVATTPSADSTEATTVSTTPASTDTTTTTTSPTATPAATPSATPVSATPEPNVASKEVETKPKQFEEWSSAHRVACVAELGGYHFNLKELSMPIDE